MCKGTKNRKTTGKLKVTFGVAESGHAKVLLPSYHETSSVA